MSDTVSAPHFDELKACFGRLGSRLSDAQLLELADLYHDLIRARRPVGARARAARDARAAPGLRRRPLPGGAGQV